MTTATDGRVLRGARNREAIVDALLALYRAGELQPTTQQVAEAADVAPRSVYHHFADMEDLIGEVARRQLHEYGHLMDAPTVTGTLGDRATALVARRGELFDAVAPVRRAAVLQLHRSRALRDNLGALARRLRKQVEQLFAAELGARSPTARAELVDVLDVLTSWEAWERLRSQQRLDARRARAVLVAAITTLLADPGKEVTR
jgi:TetR/AcrR family transcriptional regulator of autoinduction and epiphytic fitness